MKNKVDFYLEPRQMRIWVEIDDLSVEEIASTLSSEIGHYVTTDQVINYCKENDIRKKSFRRETMVNLVSSLTTVESVVKEIQENMDSLELHGDLNEVIETIDNQEIVAEAMFKVSNELN